jgi:transcriptional regulator GlxA family with amidase domain
MDNACRSGARGHGAAASHQETVEQIEAYMRANIDAPMRVSTLCQIVGLSERALREAFYRVHGISPKQWMLAERLQGVRRTLTNQESAPLSVTGVATRFGFYELGRFAGSYKEAFGETPSVTLRGAIRKSVTTHAKGHADVCTR